MRIPSVPKEKYFTDIELQTINSSWINFFSIITDELQHFLGPDGYRPPTLTTSEITEFEPDSESRLAYDIDEKEYKINNSGLYKQISTYIELTATEIAALPTIEKKGFIYDTTNDELFIGIGGVLREITIT